MKTNFKRLTNTKILLEVIKNLTESRNNLNRWKYFNNYVHMILKLYALNSIITMRIIIIINFTFF